MLYSESEKAHVSDACFPVDQLDNAPSLGSFLFEQQGLATASLKPVRQTAPTSAQNAGSASLQAGSIPVPGKIWRLLGGPRQLKWLCTKHSLQTVVTVPRSGMEESH